MPLSEADTRSTKKGLRRSEGSFSFHRQANPQKVGKAFASREWIWRDMIGDWQDEWDLKRGESDRSVNRHDICRIAAYLNGPLQRTPQKRRR